MELETIQLRLETHQPIKILTLEHFQSQGFWMRSKLQRMMFESSYLSAIVVGPTANHLLQVRCSHTCVSPMFATSGVQLCCRLMAVTGMWFPCSFHISTCWFLMFIEINAILNLYCWYGTYIVTCFTLENIPAQGACEESESQASKDGQAS